MADVLKTAPLRAVAGPLRRAQPREARPPHAGHNPQHADEGGSGGSLPVVSEPPAAPDCPARGHWVKGKLSADAVGHVPVVGRFVQHLLVF